MHTKKAAKKNTFNGILYYTSFVSILIYYEVKSRSQSEEKKKFQQFVFCDTAMNAFCYIFQSKDFILMSVVQGRKKKKLHIFSTLSNACAHKLRPVISAL